MATPRSRPPTRTPRPATRKPFPTAFGMTVAAALVATVLAGGGCAEPAETVDVTPAGGAVSAGTPAATRIGQEILSRGGNAADAAVAVSLALAVSEPGQSGLGGSAVALVRAPGAEPVVIHVPGTEVGDGEGGGVRIVLPALLPVLERLWRRHGSGTLEWEELVEPAARLAEEGFPLGRLAHRTLVREYPRLLRDPRLSALFLTENEAIHAEGSLITRPSLAETLRRLARQGPADLQRGELANDLARWAEEAGIPLDRARLAGAPPAEEVPALRGAYGGWTVWVAPEPFAGPAVLRGLALLERAPSGVWEAPPEVRAPWLAEALTWALGSGGSDVDAYLASLPPLPAPAPDTAAPGSRGTAGASRDASPVPGAAAGEGETTHFTVADDAGGVVAVTQTLGGPYGAGIPAGDLGFVLGRPGGEGVAALPGATAEQEGGEGRGGGDGADDARSGRAWAGSPERRWLSPALVTSGDSVELALGSPGGPRGVSAVVQVIAGWTRTPRDLQRVVSEPRVHVGPGPTGRRGRVYLEGMRFEAADSVAEDPGSWSSAVRDALHSRGFLATERDTGLYFQGVSPWFGGVNAVARVGGDFFPAADPRRDGTARRTNEGLPEEGALTTGEGEEERLLPPP